MQATSVGTISLAALAFLVLPFGSGARRGAGTADLAAGKLLYERHCAVCHGAAGRGDGAAAYLLHPAPRDFGSGRFRLVSTANAMPTQADLIATIRRGMPGSSMPPWEWLAEEDLWNLALYVSHLAVEGQTADLLRWAEEEEDDLSADEARELVTANLVPGEPIDPGPPAASDPVTLEHGRRLYLKMCASCHGESGTGDASVNLSGELRNEDGTPSTARDFTAGIFKGGSTHADIARRIVAGLPGSPMPATTFEDPHDLAALSAFVRSLVKPNAEERVLQRRTTVPVARTSALPAGPSDAAWAEAEAVWIALMPLWWRDQRVEGVIVRALHDGNTIAVRLSWRDASNDKELIGAQSFSDCAAIEISVERDPPLFAMGTVGHPIDIALWRAAWSVDALAARDVRDRWPGMVDDRFPDLLGDLADQAITARAVGNSQALENRPSAAEALMAQGFGTLGARAGAPSSWTAQSTWDEGYWDVVFSRAMNARNEGEPALDPGLSAFLAFAIWDGAFGDRNGQKSVSVWHRLQVAP
jgi:mono/diheme cytochrome c family protein